MLTSKTRLTALATTLIIAGTISATPAFAASQKDVSKCRTAIAQNTSVDMDDYRLRFVKERGNRNRTLTFKAISQSSDNSFGVTCEITRSKVVATNFETAPTRALAQNKKAK